MSSIDQYHHTLLGFIECPSTFDFVFNNPTRKIPINRLDQNIPLDETKFDGKAGDWVVGDGSGGAPSFRISIPETILFLNEEYDEFDSRDELYKAFWTPTEAYIFCEGFSRLGWTPDVHIESWLAENICSLLINNLSQYAQYKIKDINKSALSFFKDFG